MLDLDYLHRVQNPLGRVLAGKLRWVAADAIGCEYARQYAAADLREAGFSDAEIEQLGDGADALSPAERSILALARKLTLAAAHGHR